MAERSSERLKPTEAAENCMQDLRLEKERWAGKDGKKDCRAGSLITIH